MLCGVSVVFNSLGDVLGLVCCKCNSEKGQVLIGFQSTEAFGCLHYAGGGPVQRLGGVDDRQPAGLGIQPTLGQLGGGSLDDGGDIGCSCERGERLLMAVSINAEGGDTHEVIADG